MKTEILGLLAETSIHSGSGQDAGFVDLPVAREAATDYPVIVGSSFKGALLDRAREEKLEDKTIGCESAKQRASHQRISGSPVRICSSGCPAISSVPAAKQKTSK